MYDHCLCSYLGTMTSALEVGQMGAEHRLAALDKLKLVPKQCRSFCIGVFSRVFSYVSSEPVRQMWGAWQSLMCCMQQLTGSVICIEALRHWHLFRRASLTGKKMAMLSAGSRSDC
eukprot:scaffold160041_cov20-Tisochrysis_lutea.AAC.2